MLFLDAMALMKDTWKHHRYSTPRHHAAVAWADSMCRDFSWHCVRVGSWIAHKAVDARRLANHRPSDHDHPLAHIHHFEQLANFLGPRLNHTLLPFLTVAEPASTPDIEQRGVSH
eukprot:3107450-Rhodomonas_salina.3